MKIGIVDAEIFNKKHRFPNLASMKISGYHKSLGDKVSLITNYNPDKLSMSNIATFKRNFDKIYISKVFPTTPIPIEMLDLSIANYGGSGFFYSDAENLPPYIENHMPDYHLYDDWIAQQKANGSPDKEFKYYELYSMGYTTRGCVRQCNFCINKHCTKVEKASPIEEFFDKDKRYICLLDDNILAYENWKDIFISLNSLNKQFEFKQGLDIRMLTEEKAKVLVESNLYIPSIYFAFDNISESLIIQEKLKLWRKYYKKHTSMYVLCGYDENSIYDDEFWSKDIEDTLERIKICMKYNVFPYIMRYKNYKSAPSPYYGMYVNLASWCNQKGTIVKYSFTDWVNRMQKSDEKLHNKTRLYSIKKYYFEYAGKHPEIAHEYFDLHYDDVSEYKYVRDNNAEGIEKPVNKPKTKRDIKLKVIKEIVKIEDRVIEPIKKEIIKTKETPNVVNNSDIDFYEKCVPFIRENIKDVYKSNIDLIILNSKIEAFDDWEKSIVLLSNISLKDSSSLFVNNLDLKSFNLAREYIEENTNLKFKEVATFSIKNSKEQWCKAYCSRYSLANEVNIFNADKKYIRRSLLEDIISKSSKNGDVVLNFFDRYTIFQNIKNVYYTRKWFHFTRKSCGMTNSAVKSINEIIENKNNEQTSIIDNSEKLG
jgi:hypothetical protein